MEHLVTELNKASRLYYVGLESDMSDKQWDYLYRELEDLEHTCGFKYECSPTRNVGYPPDDCFDKTIEIEE